MPMRWIALLVAAALSAAAGAKAGPDPSPDQIARLVAQLGSARFAEREAATRALDAIGDAALDALKTAATAADAETRRRASELLDRIGQRNMVARLLKPTSIALDFNNVPLEEAVKTLARSTGLPIELPAPARYSARRVTVKSGPLPVWEAIELFCRKADLHEWDGASP